MKRHAILAGIGLSMLAFTFACSASGPASPSPFGPSPSGIGSAPTGGTTIIGTTSGLTSLAASRQPATATTSAVSSAQVCVNGTTCANVDEDGRFELRGEFAGDISLEVVRLEGSSILLTIPAVIEGETIVVRLEIEGSTSQIEILSRSFGNGGSLDDASSDDASNDDAPSSDNPSEDNASEDSPSDDALSEDDASDDPSDDSSSDDTSGAPVPA